MSQPLPTERSPGSTSGIDHSTQIKNLQQLVHLRWLAVFGPWVARLLPIYLKPRADGRPG